MKDMKMHKNKEIGAIIYMSLWTLANLSMFIYELVNDTYNHENNMVIAFTTLNMLLGTMFVITFKYSDLRDHTNNNHHSNPNTVCCFMLTWAIGIVLMLSNILCFSFGCDFIRKPEGIFMMTIATLLIVPTVAFLCTLE